MAIASKPKPSTHHKKRVAAHHRKSKQYVKSYWPYIPMLLIVALGFIISSFVSHPHAVLGWQQNLNQEAMLLATNNDRRTNQRHPLELNPELEAAAQAKAADMVQKNYWSHTTPSGLQPWTFVDATDYQYKALGENLAYGFTSADAVLNGWMNSPEHRANVIDTTYSQVGFGVAQSPNFQGKGSQLVVVALYGSPAQQSGHFLTNDTTALKPVAVSRIEAFKPNLSGLVIGAIGMLAIGLVLLRHAIAWRRLVNRGEMLIISHPWVDTIFVGIAVVAVVLNQTIGFIR